MDLPNKITIVLASDNMYAVMIAALIKSIELNHKTKENLEFFVIDDGISNRNIEKIKKSVDTTTTINWMKSNKIIPSYFKFPSDRGSLPFTTYLRLFAPYIVGEHCKKLIYMDVDMLLYDDISKFYN
ncbi:MAG: glycosyltransferase family 8 protein, partial [Rickettsiales bacterium]